MEVIKLIGVTLFFVTWFYLVTELLYWMHKI